MSIIFTDAEDTIAGYPCKKAIAIYSGLAKPEVELWYTTAISMDRPNWFGPYSEVPGVLLQYEMIQYGMRMKLRACKVTPGSMDQQRLVRKPDHDLVEPAVLQHELQEVLSTFSS
jgi:GLPGLI family protein